MSFRPFEGTPFQITADGEFVEVITGAAAGPPAAAPSSSSAASRSAADDAGIAVATERT